VLKKYAACSDETQVKKAEVEWMARLEMEYATSREECDDGDPWKGGNVNRRVFVDSEDEGEGDGNQGEEGLEEGGSVDGIYLGREEPLKQIEAAGKDEEGEDPYAIPDGSGDDEEMTEIRRKILASKPFSNPADTGQKKAPESIPRPQQLYPDSDVELDSDNGEGDDEFDNIINATPVTDRIGLAKLEKERSRTTVTSRTFL
jgi:pre-rRNA-processing protein TSR3